MSALSPTSPASLTEVHYVNKNSASTVLADVTIDVNEFLAGDLYYLVKDTASLLSTIPEFSYSLTDVVNRVISNSKWNSLPSGQKIAITPLITSTGQVVLTGQESNIHSTSSVGFYLVLYRAGLYFFVSENKGVYGSIGAASVGPVNVIDVAVNNYQVGLDSVAAPPEPTECTSCVTDLDLKNLYEEFLIANICPGDQCNWCDAKGEQVDTVINQWSLLEVVCKLGTPEQYEAEVNKLKKLISDPNCSC